MRRPVLRALADAVCDRYTLSFRPPIDMAQRKTSAPGEGRTRIRRTDDQLIRDLQAKIEEIQHRAEARQAKRSPSVRLTVRALRAIDKAMAAAEGEGESSLRHILSDGREPLVSFLEAKGLRVRKSRRPKGPRPKPEES